jgi:hypothetical protein
LIGSGYRLAVLHASQRAVENTSGQKMKRITIESKQNASYSIFQENTEETGARDPGRVTVSPGRVGKIAKRDFAHPAFASPAHAAVARKGQIRQ